MPIEESTPIIRPERPLDRAAVHALHREAFPTDAEARLVDALRDAGRLAISLVALDDAAIVGHVGFSPVTVDSRTGEGAGPPRGHGRRGERAGAPRLAFGTTGPLGLAPVAVMTSHRRRGVAARLVRAGLDACREMRVPFVVVLGDPGYYCRFGFAPARGRGLHDEYGGGDAFQVLELRQGIIPAEGGLVRYAPEFGTVTGG